MQGALTAGDFSPSTRMALSGSLVLGVATCETIRQSIPEDCTRVVDEACGNEKAPGGPAYHSC